MISITQIKKSPTLLRGSRFHSVSKVTVFYKAFQKLRAGGLVYIGELHPFKQYTGTKARFETAEGMQIVACYNHHVSDFTKAAKQAGFEIQNLEEWFDNSDRESIPRILTMVFKKPG